MCRNRDRRLPTDEEVTDGVVRWGLDIGFNEMPEEVYEHIRRVYETSPPVEIQYARYVMTPQEGENLWSNEYLSPLQSQ